jgi:hypothetical protein
MNLYRLILHRARGFATIQLVKKFSSRQPYISVD